MAEVIAALKNQIIVSVQASAGEPLDKPEIISALSQSVVSGGAKGLRLAGVDNIKAVKKACPDMPVIGITKPDVIPDNFTELVYITPTFEDVELLVGVGTDIIATDATRRTRPDGQSLEALIEKVETAYPEQLLMADIATIEEGLHVDQLGFDLISTTLSGYTEETVANATDKPDFDLLSKLVSQCTAPIVLEGRVWHPEEVTRAFELGAHCVVIGSAITRPHHITRRFVNAVPQ